jgi:hypothetical protein
MINEKGFRSARTSQPTGSGSVLGIGPPEGPDSHPIRKLSTQQSHENFLGRGCPLGGQGRGSLGVGVWGSPGLLPGVVVIVLVVVTFMSLLRGLSGRYSCKDCCSCVLVACGCYRSYRCRVVVPTG